MLLRHLVKSNLMKSAAARALHVSPASCSHGQTYWGYEKAAGRDVVGWGFSGEPMYQDRQDFWYPAIRFRKEDEAIKKIREKEKGDWKQLTMEEKKALYRHSFCKTYAEFSAPTGYWKVILAIVCTMVGTSLWIEWWLHEYILPPLPFTFHEVWKEAALQRMIDMKYQPITGIARKWDYEKERWKG